MDEVEERQDGYAVCLLPHQRHPGCLAARIELEAKRVQNAIRCRPVNKTDGEWFDFVDSGSPAQKQQPCSLLRARHERLVPFVQYEYCHFKKLQKAFLTELVTRVK
jgi:hypothetical protein